MKSLLKFLLLIYFLIGTSTFSKGQMFEKNKVNIILNYWTSQNISSLIYKSLLDKIKVPTHLEKMSYEAQWDYFEKDELTLVQTEIWQSTIENTYLKFLKKNIILDAGSYHLKGREGWWYPNYVKKLCPKLPNWKALKKCYKLFSITQSKPKGVFYTGPWPYHDELRIKALNLKFKVVVLRTQTEIISKIEEAYKQRKPILIMNWTPNSYDTLNQGEFVQFPKYHKDCIDKKSWGMNKNATYDCGIRDHFWLKKVASRNISKKFPCAYEILKNFNFTNEELTKLSTLVDKKKIPIKRVVWNWLAENEKTWETWVPTNCF